MRVTIAATVMLVIAGVAAPLCAQVLEPPARVGGRPRAEGGTRTRKEASAQGSLLGGFDDNLAPGNTGGVGFENRGSGYMGFGDASWRYLVARGTRSLNLNARGFANTYRSVGLTPSYGGDANVDVESPLGRRNTIGATQAIRYDPYFTLGAFEALRGELGTANPDTNTTNAVTQTPSLSNSTAAHFTREWTRRFDSGVTYSHTRTTFLEGTNFDTRSQSVSVSLGQSIFRRGRIRSSYAYADNDFVVADGSRLPMRNQQVDLGYEHARDLSRTRSVSYSFGAGGYHVDTLDQETRLPIQYWSPSGYGTLRYDFARTWNVSADYRRTISVLQGLTPVFYDSDTASLRAGGVLANRLGAVVIFGYVNGQAGEGVDGRYDGYTGSAQLRVTVTRNWSCSVMYNHYQYRLNTEASLSLRVAPELHRNTFLMGFNWNLPITTPRGPAVN